MVPLITPPVPGSLPTSPTSYSQCGKSGKTGTFPESPETGKVGKVGKPVPISCKAESTTDLLGDDFPLGRKNDRPEAAALTEVLKALESHTAVAWCHRMNSGAFRIGKRFVRFGWPGCPDVLGQLKDGRLLGVEVKAQKGKLRPEQSVFLERIRFAGGVAFMARDCRDVFCELDKAGGGQR